MILKTLKTIASSRVGLAALMFIAGGIVTYLFLPEKIRIEKEEVIKYVDKVVEKEVIKYVDRIVEKEVEVYIKEKVVKQKITYPDGKIVETEIYESESEQVSRMRELEKQKYQEVLYQQEQEYLKQINELKLIINPKKFIMYAGASFNAKDINGSYFVGSQYNFWGPLVIGMQASNRADLGLTVGIKF